MACFPAVLARGPGRILKVALVCPYAWDRPGGVQSHIRSLAPALRRRGHEVQVFAPRSFGGSGDATGGADAGGVTLVGRAVGIPANGSIAPICFGPVAAVEIRRGLARFHPDVIHLHEPLVPSLSLLALWSAPAPAVGTFHAAAPSSALYRLSSPLLTFAARRLAARTAVSPAAERLIARYFPGEIQLTPNGIDVAPFADAEPIDLGPGPHVLFVGRLEPRKGAGVLMEAMASIRDLDATLHVAGDGRLRAELEASARRLDLDVRFHGAVSDADKARLFRSCDVYCAPNLGGESFGIVLIEAMAAGCPVVCSDLEEFRAVAGDAAEFARAGDPDAIASALRSVVTDPGRAGSMSRDGTARAAVFDWSEIVPQLETIYARAAA
ncbi:MAG: glycosyltransferase family 4 protein [Actinomycetota bacterium]|nr:glycosyltransferase family 4 protein [Actinomycetota bacterium]